MLYAPTTPRGVLSPRVLLVALLSVGLLSAQSGRGTLAYFTSAVSSSGNTFSAGTLNLLLNGTATTGSITFDTATTGLRPGQVRYGYVSVTNDNAGSDAVDATLTSTITRTASTTAPSTAAKADALDQRLNVAVKDMTGVGGVTSSATCASNFATQGTGVTLAAPLATAPTASANRTALTSGSATTFFNAAVSLLAGVTRQYCIQVAWVDGTSGAALTTDNSAKQGAGSYVVTFNAQST